MEIADLARRGTGMAVAWQTIGAHD